MTSNSVFSGSRPLRITPGNHPWDQIHWELWLRKMLHSRGKTPPSRTHDARPRPCRSRIFPRGTCWTFHAGKPCSGCNYEHICYKCGQNTPLVTVPHRGTSSATEPRNRDLQVSSILLSPPVTPVKVDRLDFLLQGYQSHLAT